MPNTDTLRTLLSGGLTRDEALVQLRDTGVSPEACVKALHEVEPIGKAEAQGLIARLNSIPTPAEADRQARDWADDHPGEAVAAAFAALGAPPVSVSTIENQGAWYSLVMVRDDHVVWRFERERSVWIVEASPAWSTDHPFSVTLLARQFAGRRLSVYDKAIEERIREPVADLVAEVGLVRQPIKDGFRQDTWAETSAHLERLRHQPNID